MRLQAKAEELHAKGLFLGGPVEDFEAMGRLQLIVLLRAGLCPGSKVVDIGCGCLRGGYWLVHFLDPGCYFGIEPATEMLEAGVTQLLEPEVRETKRPRFDTNSDFDTSVFGEKFDFFMARSIWTHASRQQIRLMLDSFARDAATGGVFLASYLPSRVRVLQKWRARLARLRHRLSSREGHREREDPRDTWSPKLAYRRLDWIQHECEQRGLSVVELDEDRFKRQAWLRITRAGPTP
jgi:SAM-dependent methyltransferase